MKRNLLIIGYVIALGTSVMLQSCHDGPICPIDNGGLEGDTTWVDDSTSNNPNGDGTNTDSTWTDPNGGNDNDSTWTDPNGNGDNDSTWTDPNGGWSDSTNNFNGN